MELRDAESKSYIKFVTLVLSIGEGNFLIATLWISKTGRHSHRLHPKLFGADAKFRAKAEERSLFRSCGRNVSLKNLPSANIFYRRSNCE